MSRRLRLTLVVVVVALGLLAAGCGSSGTSGAASSASASRAAARDSAHGLQGLILKPPKTAPPLALPNFAGGPVSLARYRGRAVLVTFVYTHCPDVCPLIVSNLAAAQRSLGAAASRVKILAVTVDPRRDTPSAVRSFLRVRDALGRMDYLLGSMAALRRTWKAWDVAVVTGKNKLTAGHSSIIYGITASGRIAVVYPSDFTPAEIVHDVPLLASS
jgi:protein SCO1/2